MSKTVTLSITLFILILLSIGATLADAVLVLFSAPQVTQVNPRSGTKDLALNSIITIHFDKPVKRREFQHSIVSGVGGRFFQAPKEPDLSTYGEWKFKNPLIKNHLFRTLVFVPAVNFKPNTQYQIKLENITGFGLDKSSNFSFSFETQPPISKGPTNSNNATTTNPDSPKPNITILDTPLDWQDDPLSCEAASLKMALAEKGVFVSEQEIMEKIGYDSTPHQGDTWGDPHRAYVGNINGKICETGYGVYWGPVAKAAQNWRPAQSFINWNIKDLTQEIKNGNPVLVWGVLPTGTVTDCSWHTPQGKFISAFKETHVRLVIGFIGPPTDPSKIILNDPLAGRIYWSTDYFLKNWKVFNYSGVVVR